MMFREWLNERTDEILRHDLIIVVECGCDRVAIDDAVLKSSDNWNALIEPFASHNIRCVEFRAINGIEVDTAILA